ncbi:MAG: glycosyltransferase family 39 protein [Candidatus Sumerlaeia bacterium]|nr:glycosyltransferase family 39 protein [Candidatus Sumerlaeia bacterium]
MHSDFQQPAQGGSIRTPVVLGVFSLLYAAAAAVHFSVGYQDFGDGNYLYIARRVADGAVLYRDILAPQPPCHLLVGAGLIRLGRLWGAGVEVQLAAVRTFSVLLHLATMLAVWAIARRLFGCAATALWAAGLYLVIPIGFWWTLSFESEPLEMFFLLWSFFLIIHWKRGTLTAAGLLGALGVLTNMTAVCYVGWVVLFLAVCDWRRALWYGVPATACVGAATAAGEWLSGRHYLENVFFNQVGTFPHPDLLQLYPPDAPLRGIRTVLHYALGKIAREGGDVLNLEGVFISAAIVGMLFYLTKENGSRVPNSHVAVCPSVPPYHRAFVGWYAFGSLMSIGFVSKGATMDYIFTIGEPFVCLFAAHAIATLGRLLSSPSARPIPSPPCPKPKDSLPRRLHVAAVAAAGLVVLFARPALWIYEVAYLQRQHELRSADVQTVRRLVEEHSRPGDRILAAPYFAFIADRNLIEELSELFIWDIKYLLEQHVAKQPGPATQKVEAIAEALRRKAVPVAVVNLRPGETGFVPTQIFGVPEVAGALARNYQSLLPQPLRGLNAYVDVRVPK